MPTLPNTHSLLSLKKFRGKRKSKRKSKRKWFKKELVAIAIAILTMATASMMFTNKTRKRLPSSSNKANTFIFYNYETLNSPAPKEKYKVELNETEKQLPVGHIFEKKISNKFVPMCYIKVDDKNGYTTYDPLKSINEMDTNYIYYTKKNCDTLQKEKTLLGDFANIDKSRVEIIHNMTSIQKYIKTEIDDSELNYEIKTTIKDGIDNGQSNYSELTNSMHSLLKNAYLARHALSQYIRTGTTIPFNQRVLKKIITRAYVTLDKPIIVFRADNRHYTDHGTGKIIDVERANNIQKGSTFTDEHFVPTCAIMNTEYVTQWFFYDTKTQQRTKHGSQNDSPINTVMLVKKGVKCIPINSDFNGEYELIIEPGCKYKPQNLSNTKCLDYYIEVSKP